MRWQILRKIKTSKKNERQKEIIRALFLDRDLKTKKQQENFLNPKNPDELTSRDLGISPVQLAKAIKRIRKAIKNKEKIVVYGDYDTDGVCATAIMWEILYLLGARAMPFIPKREEGYGLKVDRIDQMAKDGVSLIITVDQGIVHSRQVAHAERLGVEVIITDHHLSGERKPKAVAIVHTTKLAGCGVAWFLAKHLRVHFQGVHTWKVKYADTFQVKGHLGGGHRDKDASEVDQDSLGLAAIGTVTDVVPLVGSNRSMVKFGLEAVRKTKRPGLLALYKFAGLEKEKIGTYEIGYIIGPRLNASGRMDDPLDSLRLICTKNRERVASLAREIDQKNRERQDLTKQTAIHARELWLKEDGESSLIFIYHQSYEHGVIGLVAGKLKDEFYRPAVVLAPRQDHWVASARSIEEFNIVEAIRACADLLGDHGGHRLAAGFSVSPEKMREVKKRLVKTAEEQLEREKLSPTLKIDAEVNLADLDFKLYKEIEKFAPFGQKNPQPVFATREVEVVEAKTVGRDKQHLKLTLRPTPNKDTPLPRSVLVQAIAFGLGHLYEQLSPEKPIDIAYSLLVDEWNGQRRLQLKIRDIKV